MGNEIIITKPNWLKLEDYQFNILVLVKMLSTNEEQTTYSGTLQDMRKWLNLGQSPKNNRCIINAINELKNNNIIDYTPNGRTYNISIIDEIKENDHIIYNINKNWVNEIRSYNVNNNKRRIESMLKIFLYAYNNVKGEYITISKIGSILNLTYNQVINAINNLQNCHFKDYSLFCKNYEKEKKGNINLIRGIILQFISNGIYNNY